MNIRQNPPILFRSHLPESKEAEKAFRAGMLRGGTSVGIVQTGVRELIQEDSTPASIIGHGAIGGALGFLVLTIVIALTQKLFSKK